MDRLSPLDAAFLAAEDADAHVSMAIASVGIFDGAPPCLEELTDALESRLPLIPRYRQRIWRAPFDVTTPAWVDDPRFDIRRHVRHAALPSPGDDSELFALIARLMSERLDRDRPLWETWMIEGLAGGRWALLSKIHHCMVDGVGGTDLYYLLLSTTDDWEPAPPAAAPMLTATSRRRLYAEAVVDAATLPARQLELAVAAARRPRDTIRTVATTARGLLASAHVLLPSDPSTLQGPIGDRRAYAATVVPLGDVKDVSHRLGVTVNDVALAVVTGGFRALLESRDEPCHAHSVRSLVPVSVRPAADQHALANKVSCMFADLPVHLSDPIDRLQHIHTELAAAKAHKEAEAGEALVELSTRQPFGLMSPLLRAAFAMPQHSLVTVTTNVPGPRDPLYLMGRPMRRLLPFVPIADRVRVGVAILSYCDEIAFGVTADYASGRDIHTLLDGIRTDLAALTRLDLEEGTHDDNTRASGDVVHRVQ